MKGEKTVAVIGDGFETVSIIFTKCYRISRILNVEHLVGVLSKLWCVSYDAVCDIGCPAFREQFVTYASQMARHGTTWRKQ